MSITRDQWLDRCAARLVESGEMNPGEAAQYARVLAESEEAMYGLAPRAWTPPAKCAEDDIARW